MIVSQPVNRNYASNYDGAYANAIRCDDCGSLIFEAKDAIKVQRSDGSEVVIDMKCMVKERREVA